MMKELLMILKKAAIAEKILERAVKAGIIQENVIIDPLAMAVSADPQACLVTLETIRLVHQKLGSQYYTGSQQYLLWIARQGSPEFRIYELWQFLMDLPARLPILRKLHQPYRATDLILEEMIML